MNRLSLRLRLTLLVTAAFVIAITVAGAIARSQLEQTLVETARSNAADTLTSSFPTPATDTSETSPVVSFEGITRFVFTDAEGNDLGQEDFAAIIDEATAAQLAELGAFLDEMPFDPSIEVPDAAMFATESPVFVEGAVTIVEPFTPVGDLIYSETVDDIIVAQRLLIGDEELTVKVQTPRQPLNDSLAAFTRLALILAPVLGGLVALATWFTTSHVLRPVEDIRLQVAQTGADQLHQHVPRSGNGDEIDRLAVTMNEMLDRLRDAAEHQRQFVSDASHELRSPITATIATLETIDPARVADQWPELSAVLSNEQLKLSRLVDDLLLLATVDEQWAARMDEDVDLDELVLTEAGRTFETPVDARIARPRRVVGNARLLQRCLANLVENAARHAATAVEIVLTTNDKGEAVVQVRDDGLGVPDEYLESIFERFTRVDAARNRKDGGAGLGLAIARDIATAHGASLIARNRETGGAEFELTFR